VPCGDDKAGFDDKNFSPNKGLDKSERVDLLRCISGAAFPALHFRRC
jgi:hypothetical protein